MHDCTSKQAIEPVSLSLRCHIPSSSREKSRKPILEELSNGYMWEGCWFSLHYLLAK